MTHYITEYDSSKANNFLQSLPHEYHNIVAIDPNTGNVTGITRRKSDPYLLAFIAQNNGKRNLYYSANEPKEDAPDSKLTKDHIKHVNALYIDADPHKGKDYDAERARLKTFADKLHDDMMYAPTFIVDSGGGYQAVWLLDKPVNEFALAEEYGRGLAAKYNTDAVQNIDRILRLPYTVNLPTPKKIEQGRVKRVATVTHADKNKYTWKDLKTICKPLPAPTYDDLTDADFDDSLLTPELTWRDVPLLEQRLYKLMDSDHKLRAMVFGSITLPSRSEYDFLLASRLKTAGWELRDTAIAMWLSEKGKGKELTVREITRAYARATDEFAEMAVAGADEIMRQILAACKPATAALDADMLAQFAKFGIQPPSRLFPKCSMPLTMTAKPMFKNLLDQSSLWVIYGQSNVGKSFAALSIAAHLALGSDWAGHKCKERMAVLYVCAEAGRGFIKREIAIKRRLGIPDEATFEEFPFIIETMDVNFFESPTTTRDDGGDVVKWIKLYEAMHGIKFGLVIIDTLATSFAGGNENSGEDMTKYVGHCKMIQHNADVAVGIVHHSGKDQAAGARGHSSLRAATDTEMEVTATQVGAKWQREVRITKQRDGETGLKIPFGLDVVEVGKDDDGDPITTCNIILPNDNEFGSVIPSILDSLPPKERILYMAVKIGIDSSDNQGGKIRDLFHFLSKNPPSSIKQGHELVQQAGGIPHVTTTNAKIKNSTFYKCRNNLVEKGYIKIDDKKQWIDLNEK